MAEQDVIIVGGGPVGMGLAIELAQRGVRALVLERHSTIPPIPKGQNLTQRTMETMRAWGCEDALRAARPIPADVGIGGSTHYGTLLSPWHYDWLNRASVNAYYATQNERLPQYETERVLRARAAELPDITLRTGVTVMQVADRGEHAEVSLRNATGDVETLTAPYVVGCDGSRSIVRETGGIPQQMSDHGRLMVLLVFQSMELHELLKRYPGKAFFNVLHPEMEGYWQFFGRVGVGSWFFHAPVPHGTTAEHDFRSMLHRAVGQEFDLEIDYVGFWDLRVSIAQAYRAGRLFVAGDAAHSHPPYGGYGINTGFEDARNLGWKLAASLQGWGGPQLIDSYDAERRPVFESTARDFIEAFIEQDNDFLQTYHPDQDRAAFETAWYARNSGAAEVSRFAPNYQGSPLVTGSDGQPSARGDHCFTARAGHHLAPQPLASGGASTDRLATGFTLFAFGGAGSDGFVTAAKAKGIPLAVVSDDGPNAYGAALVLVRPDHYVAWAGDNAEDAVGILYHAIGA
jgi:4-hydroxyisophthalate hydroxylase